MKLKCRTSLRFKRLRPPQKAAFGASVITALSPATSAKQKILLPFPNLPIPVSDLLALNNELTQAVSDALTGNHVAVASVKSAVLAWNEAFTTTAAYITSQATGSDAAEIIRSAGFVPTKSDTTPAQKPGIAADFTATINGSKGTIIANVKTAIPDTVAYVFTAAPEGAEITYNGNTMIITVGQVKVYVLVTTKKKVELCNLTSYLPYNVSVYGINSAGSGSATTPQEVTPQ